ncbi:hypothetical protein [Dongia sp.]|uniref:hypothetical protein n=1 Tax=Dongia sp. TaxID=1977262 RepID=UPI003751BC40
MGRDSEPAVIRREAADGAGAGRAGILLLQLLGAAILGTISFYFSVMVGYLIAEADMTSPETMAQMFPPGEHWVLVVVLVTSAVAYLVIDKAGLFRAIADAGAAGWFALFPVVLVALIVLRGIAVDLVYSPVHFEAELSIESYGYLLSEPAQITPYLVDGLLLFVISVLLAKASAGVNRR